MATSITYAHDQAVPIKRQELNALNSKVDEIIEKSLLSGSPEIALRFGRDLYITGQLHGIQLARLLYFLDEIWNRFDTNDEIEDSILKDMGVSGKKFRKYRDLYKYVLLDHPELSGKPIGGLLGIVVAAREEEFEAKDWKDLALAHDSASMVAIRQQVRGIKTKGHVAVVITWDRDGYLFARRGSGEPKALGHITKERGDPVIDTARARILEGAGIVQI